MGQLIKLEWEKNQLSSYLKTAVICIGVIFALTALMAKGAESQEEIMFTDFSSFMSLASIFIRIVFVIFSGVLLSRIVVDEYKNKTVQVLFTYPINRKKVMQSKLMIVVAFCFLSILVATVSISLLTWALNPVLYFFPTSVSLKMLVETIPSVLATAMTTACLSLIPLYFGMLKQSSATTITTAVLIGFLVNSTVSDGSSIVSLSQTLIVPIILSVIGLGIGYLAYRKVDKKDIA